MSEITVPDLPNEPVPFLRSHVLPARMPPEVTKLVLLARHQDHPYGVPGGSAADASSEYLPMRRALWIQPEHGPVGCTYFRTTGAVC